MKYIRIYVATLAALATPALAQKPDEGTGLVCNKPEEIVSVMEAYDQSRDWNAAIATVNAKEVVCAVSHVLYLKGAKVKEIDTKDGHFNIVGTPRRRRGDAGGVRPVAPENRTHDVHCLHVGDSLRHRRNGQDQ